MKYLIRILLDNLANLTLVVWHLIQGTISRQDNGIFTKANSSKHQIYSKICLV